MKQDERHERGALSFLMYEGRYEGIAEIVWCRSGQEKYDEGFPLYIPQECSSPIPALPLREILVALQVRDDAQGIVHSRDRFPVHDSIESSDR